ncbi:hypothetical protein Y032_0027g1606 [Ancylostoma ceylanicum]|uniref:Uncharacterized protein n=1 Tax=Ancylostoma ceylanicum TaxID=53326 RepID=A0A016UUG8_9BILA|nr:hypothetical protein Y032_0027g1606 [Ancylostoma ceylanicum]
MNTIQHYTREHKARPSNAASLFLPTATTSLSVSSLSLLASHSAFLTLLFENRHFPEIMRSVILFAVLALNGPKRIE